MCICRDLTEKWRWRAQRRKEQLRQLAMTPGAVPNRELAQQLCKRQFAAQLEKARSSPLEGALLVLRRAKPHGDSLSRSHEEAEASLAICPVIAVTMPHDEEKSGVALV